LLLSRLAFLEVLGKRNPDGIAAGWTIKEALTGLQMVWQSLSADRTQEAFMAASQDHAIRTPLGETEIDGR
jgi:hypothetical protein